MRTSQQDRSDRLVLVIDIGSSSVKAATFSLDGSIESAQTVSYPTHTTGSGLVEQNATDWWDATSEAISRLAGTADLSRLDALTVTNQQVTTVPVTEGIVPTARAISWMDTRTAALATAVEDAIGDQVLETVGMPVSTSWAALRPKWWIENVPQVAAASRWFLTVDAYFYARLTGRVVSDHSNACFGPYDIRKRAWSEPIAAALKIDLASLPGIVEPTDVVGPLSSRAASELGLPAHLPVVAGASDQPASAVGLGATTDETAAATIGTGTFVVIPTTNPEPDARYLVSCAGVPGGWVNYGLHYVSGAAVDWLVDIVRIDNVESLVEIARDAPAGSEGLVVLPYFQGVRTPHFDHHAKGVMFGLTLGHGREHLARAFLESNAFGIRDLLEAMGSPDHSERLRLAGGGAASRIVPQMIADVTRRQIEVPESRESTSLGAALIAWTGLGRFSSVDEAAKEVVKVDRTYVPDLRVSETYERAYRTYRSLFAELRELFGEVSN